MQISYIIILFILLLSTLSFISYSSFLISTNKFVKTKIEEIKPVKTDNNIIDWIVSDITNNVVDNIIENKTEYKTNNIIDYDQSLKRNKNICNIVQNKLMKLFNDSIIMKKYIEPDYCSFIIKF